MGAAGLLFLLVALPCLLFMVIGAASDRFDEGTPDQLAANPNLNTKNWELHWQRLRTHGSSKYRGKTFYLGPRGGVYYYSANGNKVYV
jgi:hypothetical protein